MSVLRTWLPWLGRNLLRLVYVVAAVFYVVVLIGLVLEADSVGEALTAPLAAVVWTAWIGVVFVVMGIVPTAIYLLILAALPLRRRPARVRRGIAIALGPLCAFAFFGSYGSQYVDAWEEVAWMLGLSLAYGAVVRLPPSWSARRPDEPGAATP